MSTAMKGTNQIDPDKGLPNRLRRRFITPAPRECSRRGLSRGLYEVVGRAVAWLVSEGVVLSATALSRSASLSLESRFGGSGFKKQESRDKT